MLLSTPSVGNVACSIPMREEFLVTYEIATANNSLENIVVTWGENGRDGPTSSKDLRATNGPEVRKTECCGKNLKKTLTL